MSQKRNLRIKPHFSVIAHSPDVVELRAGVWNPISFTLTDSSGSGRLFGLIRDLDGSSAPAEIARRHGVPRAQVEGMIDHLHQLGVIESAASNALDYYIESLIPNLGGRESAQASHRPVLLIGDPELTSRIADYLSTSLPGGRPSVPGTDDPAPSALTDDDVSWLDDGLRFQERAQTFAGWRDRFLVCASKVVNPVRMRVLNRICLEQSIPWLHAALDGPFLFVGPTFVPGRGACYECLESRVFINLRESESYVRYKRALAEGAVHGRRAPTEPAIIGLLASHCALEALNYALAESAFTLSKILSIYLPTMEFSFNEVLRVAGCPACGSVAEREDSQQYFDITCFLNP